MDLLKDRFMVYQPENGSGVDADALSGGTVQTDAVVEPSSGEPTPEEGGTAEEPFSLQIGDDTYSEADILAAVDALKNKSRWEGELHARGEEINSLLKAVEHSRQAFQGQQPPTPPQAPSMTGEQARDMLMENPEGFMHMLSEAVNNAVNSGVQKHLGEYESRNLARDHFLGKYSDFNETVNSPDFRRFKSELPVDNEGAPIYNEANAYLAYQLDKARTMVENARKEGFLAGEQTAAKNLEAKTRIRMLRGGGHTPPQGGPSGPDVKNMSHGELLNAATAAILAKRGEGQ